MKRVLVVEDNKNNMRLIVKLLESEGYEAIKTETGEEGVRLAIEEKPDLILMDIKLPDIDGLEAARAIRNAECARLPYPESQTKKTPIIALTSYTLAGDWEKFIKAGFNGYLEKPLDPYTVIKEIEEICRKHAKFS